MTKTRSHKQVDDRGKVSDRTRSLHQFENPGSKSGKTRRTRAETVVQSTKLTQKPSNIEKLNNTEIQPRAKTTQPPTKFESEKETKDGQEYSPDVGRPRKFNLPQNKKQAAGKQPEKKQSEKKQPQKRRAEETTDETHQKQTTRKKQLVKEHTGKKQPEKEQPREKLPGKEQRGEKRPEKKQPDLKHS